MKKFFKVLPLFLLFLLNLLAFHKLSVPSKSINTTSAHGKIAVTVLEENTNKPIDNATICVIESREYYATNKNGVSELIRVPILTNSNFDSYLPRHWGEITLLVYKAGYSDHVSFYNEVVTNQTKLGIIIKLSPIYSSSDTEPTISANTPNKAWAKELIKEFKK